MHGDHIYGLPGLLASIGLAGSSSGIEIFGPAPLKNFVDACLYNSSSRLAYSLKFHKVEHAAIKNEILFEDSELEIKAAPLKHRIPSFAYRVNQKSRPGRFNINKAREKEIKRTAKLYKQGKLTPAMMNRISKQRSKSGRK